MPIVNVANHFIENNGTPVDPDSKNQRKNKNEKKRPRKK
ncbi:MAG: hypothetical protein K0R84_991 [Clostridia bacterium]|jgi:hypothetical protein|nr:hypothetical protein [Clostridia bacterium]